MTPEDLKLLGLPEDIAADKVLETFNAIYIKREDAIRDDGIKDKITGKRLGEITTYFLKSIGKENSYAHGEDKKPLRFEELTNKFIADLELEKKTIAENSKMGVDERVTKAERDAEKFKKERDGYKDKFESTTTEFESYKKDSSNNLDNVLLKYKINEFKSKIPFVDDITDIQRKGYESTLNDSYIFEFDEKKENILVKDKAGNFVNSKEKAGFASVEEILSRVADDGKILKKNNFKKDVKIFEGGGNGEVKKTPRKAVNSSTTYLGG